MSTNQTGRRGFIQTRCTECLNDFGVNEGLFYGANSRFVCFTCRPIEENLSISDYHAEQCNDRGCSCRGEL